MFEKSIIPFGLSMRLSLNDGSTFEKQSEDIYPTELELKKENDGNSCASFLDHYIYIQNGKFYSRLFDKRDNFVFGIVRISFYCSNIPSRMFYGIIRAEFLRTSRVTTNIENFSRNCKQLLSRMVKQNWQMRNIKLSLIKIIQRHQEDLIKYIYFFLSGFSFTNTDDSQASMGREGTIFYSTLPLAPAHEHSDIYLQLCI